MATNNLKISSPAPDFNLPGVDGKSYSLSSFKNKSIIAVIFSCNHCPYVQAFEDRVRDIQNDYEKKGVQIVAISSNDAGKYPEDSFEQMIKRAQEKQFNFPYLYDESQSIAKSFDATHTPEVFVFDKERKLKYHGKIDDNWKEPQKVNSRYLREALDEILSSKEVSVPETFSIGCTIKWK
ncbi:MAG: thioredoxin family protein [Ignavibacterium sp.]|nr:thioredoxin family protein [Ignavibacterium sp.]